VRSARESTAIAPQGLASPVVLDGHRMVGLVTITDIVAEVLSLTDAGAKG
jgi:Mg/Co/Ni transporter MgtE